MHNKLGHTILRLLNALRVRFHALLVLVIVAWAAYSAVSYLFRSVFWPAHVPEKFLRRYQPLQEQDLRRTDPAMATRARPDAPLGHYHGLSGWPQADPHNGCTVEGCHNVMPHQKNKGVRAFDNFHATFLTCQMCHEADGVRPLAAMWVNTTTGLPEKGPAILELLRYLETQREEIDARPVVAHAFIVEHLRTTIDAIGGDPVLDYLLVRLETAESASPVWKQALAQLESELPAHTQGEYRAKLAPAPAASAQDQLLSRDSTAYLKQAQEIALVARQYLASEPNSPKQQELDKRLHGALLKTPHNCLDCHSENGLLDFPSLGYTHRRTQLLCNSPLAQQIRLLQQGQEFFLPGHPGANK